MSETDSFIEEVSEEVRRDRLYGLIRRYGWIAVVGVVAIVGGASWNEYNKAQDRAAAQALGDGIMTALEAEDPAARAAALADVSAEGTMAGAVLTLQRASELQAAGNNAEAASLLDALASNGDVDAIY
ncbi:MAG: tetratricopeptide repeat protein, partial [Pseudomonadota bacterium]|nr:tetratricopeptide repeat protein [Pseudomonadota bacterium]